MNFHRIGADEVGLGAICGPITVCAFLAPATWTHASVKDSKRYANRAAREVVGKMLRQDKECWFSIVSIEAAEIDVIGYKASLEKAFCRSIMDCVNILLPEDRYDIIVDGTNQLPLEVPYRSVAKADRDFIHVSAASVIAKTHRDAVMAGHAKKWPQYGFEQHSGYGTQLHLERLQKHGVCDIHRKSLEMFQSK